MTEQDAYDFFESRIWPEGPLCPRCGGWRNGKLRGLSTRIGVYKCYDCRKPFTVKIGTIFEKSHIPMRGWLKAIEMLRGGANAHEVCLAIGVGHPHAWRMSCALRKSEWV